MGIDFNWQTEDQITPPVLPGKSSNPLAWLVVAVIAVCLAVAIWFGARYWLEHRDDDLKGELQAVLDLEQQAAQSGDGELFLSLQTDDPAWIAAQLLPRNQSFNQAEREVTRARQSEGEAWANVRWRENGDSRQRIVFFRWDGSKWRRSAGSDTYWGETKRYRYDWGVLILPASDIDWRTPISRFVADNVPANTPHLTLILETDDAPALEYATPGQVGEVRLPSPRFWGLDESGSPGASFWSAMAAHLNPPTTTLRFVVPDAVAFRYQGLAQTFTQTYLPGDYTIEIIPLGSLPADPRAWLPQVDGAKLTLTESLIVGGYVRDLTDMAQGDAQFEQGDFYEQIWQAAWWQDRMWMVPANAELNVIFYSREAFRAAGLPEPQAGWTWDDLTAAANTLSQPLSDGDHFWGIMDTTGDLVWGYGLSWESDCLQGPCLPDLNGERRQAALSWYAANVGQALPDVSSLTDEERELARLRWLMLQQAAMWVSSPVNYEVELSRMPLGVVTFPLSLFQATAGGVDAGITPLHVSGFIISQDSPHPRLMWEWLRYLSYTSADKLRTIPARPSVAAQNIFWCRLPGQLNAALCAALPLARAIRIGEENWLTWQQLQDPTTPVSSRPPWFQRPTY